MLRPSPARAIAATLLVVTGLATRTPVAAVPREPPKDTRERWIVGITVFRGEGLAPADAWLAWSLPLLLRDQVAGLATHAIDAEGRAAIARAAIARDRRKLLATLDALRDAHDAAAFGETRSAAPAVAPAPPATAPVPPPAAPVPPPAAPVPPPAAPVPPKASATAPPTPSDALAEAMERLAWLDGLDPAEVLVPEKKPLAIKEGSEPGLLLAAPFASRHETASREDVDLLVGGSVREASGYFLVDLWAWDTARDAEVFHWRDAATRGELYDRVAEGGRGLFGVLLGRPWASLEVAVQPLGAAVLVDGASPSAGRSRFDDLEPGGHEVRVTSAGYREQVRTVDLAAETATTLTVALEPVDLGSIAVATDPPAADAWLDAVWQGRTPLDLPRPGERARLIVSLPEGPEVVLTVGPTSPSRISISLAEAALHSDEKQKQARDRFYGSFGWLVLSLPVPFYSYYWAYDWAAEAGRLFDRGDIGGAERAVGISYTFYYAYLGGLGLSVALAGWTVYNIVRYIQAADRPTGQGLTP